LMILPVRGATSSASEHTFTSSIEVLRTTRVNKYLLGTFRKNLK